MRFRVDTLFGYISFAEKDKERAYEYYYNKTNNAIRLVKCDDIFDEGIVILGKPIVEDWTLKEKN